MARKYIKGKDGKFQGSIPDAKNAPSAAPALPKPAHPADTLVESFIDEKGNLAFRETEAARREYLQSLVRANLM